MMPDRETVIEGLKKVWDAFNHMEHEMYADYVFDALVLLKEQRFEIDEVCLKLCEYGQNDKRFKWGEIIKYSPSEVGKILNGETIE